MFSLTIWQRIWYRWFNFRKWLFCPLFKRIKWWKGYDKYDCRRYEPAPVYEWVWVCAECGGLLAEGQPGAIYQKFELEDVPTASCGCTLPVPVEKVKRTVCIHSGKLPRPFCLHRKLIEFEKGTEPTARCDVHNFKKSGRRKEMCGGALGFFLWFIRIAWKKADQVKAEELAMETFAKWAENDVTYLDWFVWLIDNKPEHKFLNGKGPYKQYISSVLKRRMFKLSEWDERFFELLDRFIYMHKLFDISPIPQVFMDRYNYYPFEHNDEGVKGFWTEKAWRYQMNLTGRVVGICKEYFGERFMVKFINEPRHREGRDADAKFHQIAVFHRDMVDQAVVPQMSSKESAYDRVVTDNSESEAGQLLIVWHGRGHHICPKCKKPLAELFPTRLVYEWMARRRKGEQHSINFISDFEKGYNSLNAFFRSANEESRWHGDGSDDCEQAEGYRVGNFCFADAKQYGETCDFAWQKQVEHNATRGKKKTVFMCPFNAETLKKRDGVFYECWEKADVNWKLIEAMKTSHIKNFG